MRKEASDLADYKTPFFQVSGLYLGGSLLNISPSNELLLFIYRSR